MEVVVEYYVHDGRIIKTNNGYVLYFDTGRIDDYCVHTVKPNGHKWYAKDYEYLHWIRNRGKDYGKDKVYTDFLKVYDIVDYDYDDDKAFALIEEIDKDYKWHETEQWWSLFYKTMVAEERKENSILGKRIKRLGVYNVLFDGYAPRFTANYMKGKRYWELEELMIERGI